MRDVPRVPSPSSWSGASSEVQRLRASLEQGAEPLVIEGGARHFRASCEWNPAELRRRFGAVEVQFKLSSSHVHPDFRQVERARMFARGRSSFAEFLDRITTGEPAERARYLFTGDEQFLWRRREGIVSVHPELGKLLDDVVVPELFAPERLHSVWGWFSGQGVRTWLHYDNNACHNLNAQITGRKRCDLYPPSELARLHPFLLGGDNPAHNCSAIDVEAPAPCHAEDLAAARAFHAELEAGDLLFIPAFWFHTFQHLGEFNSNVNFWWRPENPRWNPVAARQAVVDAVARADLGELTPALRQALHSIDSAAVRNLDVSKGAPAPVSDKR